MEERKENKWGKFVTRVAIGLGVVLGFVGYCFGKAWIELYGIPEYIISSIKVVLIILAVIYFAIFIATIIA